MLSWLHQKRGSARDFWLRRSESSSGEEKHVTACLCRSLSSLLPLNPSKSRLLLFLWPLIPPCAHVSQTSTAWTHEVFARGQDKVVGESLLCMFPFWPLSILTPFQAGEEGSRMTPTIVWGVSASIDLLQRNIWPSALFPLSFLLYLGGAVEGWRDCLKSWGAGGRELWPSRGAVPSRVFARPTWNESSKQNKEKTKKRILKKKQTKKVKKKKKKIFFF